MPDATFAARLRKNYADVTCEGVRGAGLGARVALMHGAPAQARQPAAVMS